MKVLSRAFIAASILIGSVVAASACDVQIGRPNSCDAGYRNDWARGAYGRGGPWDPNAGMRGGVVVSGGARFGHHGRRGVVGTTVVTGSTQTVVTGQKLVYRGTIVVPRAQTVVGTRVVANVPANVPPADPYAGMRNGPTAPGAPSPEAVYRQQLAAGAVTKVRVPCAAGFDTLPNGNCGRWVPN